MNRVQNCGADLSLLVYLMISNCRTHPKIVQLHVATDISSHALKL